MDSNHHCHCHHRYRRPHSHSLTLPPSPPLTLILTLTHSQPPPIPSTPEHPPHPELSAVFAQCTLVGLIDPVAALAQHGTRLLVLDLSSLTRDLFFQLALRGFERHPRVRLGEGVGVDEAVEMALVRVCELWMRSNVEWDAVWV